MDYKFKIGDKVQIISNSAEEIIYHYAPIGSIGIIDERTILNAVIFVANRRGFAMVGFQGINYT